MDCLEEQKEIWPAVIAMRERGYDVEGPLPPDTVFVKLSAGLYHIVVAMYHDQGHIPLKLCGFQMNPHTCHFDTMHGVNVTVGLPIIRTSVDHGTAYDRAGTFSANKESMVEAIETAATLIEGRRKSLV